MSSHAVALDRSAPLAGPGRLGAALAGSGALSAAMLASGLLNYAFHVVAARSLGAADYGQIAVLWAAMFVVVVVLFLPVEQMTSRAIAERTARGQEVTSVLRAAAVLVAGLLGALGVAAALLWRPLGERLFAGSAAMTAMLLAGIAVYGLLYAVRGVLGGIRWFAGYGLALFVDSLARLALAIGLVVAASKLTAAVAVVAAGLAGAAVPLCLGAARIRRALTRREGRRFRLDSAVAFAAPAGIIAAGEQVLVNGAPLLIALDGGPGASRTAGIVFAATMLVRAPVYLFHGLAATLLPNLTRLHTLDGPERFRRAASRTAAFLVVAGGALVGLTALAGPEALRLVYGADFAAGRGTLVLLAAGASCYVAAASFAQALLAVNSPRRAAAAWAAAAGVFVGLYAALPGDEIARVSVAFSTAALVALVLVGISLAARVARR